MTLPRNFWQLDVEALREERRRREGPTRDRMREAIKQYEESVEEGERSELEKLRLKLEVKKLEFEEREPDKRRQHEFVLRREQREHAVRLQKLELQLSAQVPKERKAANSPTGIP